MIGTGGIVGLGVDDAGELLTLQRAAYVTEAQLHQDVSLPALTQSMPEILDELADPAVRAWGIRSGARLVAAMRIRVEGPVAELGRLVVVPDMQGQGLGTRLIDAVDSLLPDMVNRVELFTGEKSVANIRLYQRKGFTEMRRRNVGAYDLAFLARPRESLPHRD